MTAETRALGVAGEIVRSVGALPAIVVASLLLFPAAVTGFLLWRIDDTIQKLAVTMERQNALITAFTGKARPPDGAGR